MCDPHTSPGAVFCVEAEAQSCPVTCQRGLATDKREDLNLSLPVLVSEPGPDSRYRVAP